MSGCGTCTACCTLLGIRELRKPAGLPCPHSSGAGCAIYADRPTSCREFKCLFLRDGLDMRYRPDLCGMILHQLPDDHVMATMHPDHTDAWQNEPVRSLLQRLVMAGQRVILSKDGETYLMSESGTSARKVHVHIEEAA